MREQKYIDGFDRLIKHFKRKIQLLRKKEIEKLATKIDSTIQELIGDEEKKIEDFKIVFLFGAGASQPAGGSLSTSEIIANALRALDPKLVIRFLGENKLREIGIEPSELKKEKPNLTFEQTMTLLRRYFGERPKCAEILLFQNKFPRSKIIDVDRDLLPVPLIYEITSHLVKHKLVDHVITTNFDELLDRALEEEIGKKEFARVHHLSKYESVLVDKVYEEKPLLIKVHGTISYSLTLRQLVDNVFAFERHKEELLTKILKDSVVIIVGFGFNTPNLQKLFYKLKTQGLLKDIFVVKRSRPTRFINFLLEEHPENFIKEDCEKFAKILAEKLEEIGNENENKNGNGNSSYKGHERISGSSPGDTNEIRFVDYFPDFSRHITRYFFFNKLKLYPSRANKFLVEFIMALLKGRGLITHRSLMDCKHSLKALQEDRSSLIASIEEKIKFLEERLSNKEKQEKDPRIQQLEKMKEEENRDTFFHLNKIFEETTSRSSGKETPLSDLRRIIRRTYLIEILKRKSKSLPLSSIIEPIYYLCKENSNNECKERFDLIIDKLLDCLENYLKEESLIMDYSYKYTQDLCNGTINEKGTDVEEVKEVLEQIKERLKKLPGRFDIDIRAFHFPPIPFIKEGKEDLIYYIESKIQLEIINEYLWRKAKKEACDITIHSETGEWLEKRLKELQGSQEPKITVRISGYGDLDEYAKRAGCQLYHSKCRSEEYKNKLEDYLKTIGGDGGNSENSATTLQEIPFFRNDLHFTLFEFNNKVYEGIVFYRNLKSSIISPIFIRTQNLEKFYKPLLRIRNGI